MLKESTATVKGAVEMLMPMPMMMMVVTSEMKVEVLLKKKCEAKL